MRRPWATSTWRGACEIYDGGCSWLPRWPPSWPPLAASAFWAWASRRQFPYSRGSPRVFKNASRIKTIIAPPCCRRFLRAIGPFARTRRTGRRFWRACRALYGACLMSSRNIGTTSSSQCRKSATRSIRALLSPAWPGPASSLPLDVQGLLQRDHGRNVSFPLPDQTAARRSGVHRQGSLAYVHNRGGCPGEHDARHDRRPVIPG